VDAAGIHLDAVAIVLTASPRAVVRVPLRRAAKVLKPISEAQASLMDENVAPPATLGQTKMARARAAKRQRGLMAEFGRLGGLTKARNRAA